ncbi:MAG: glycosyltransferase family 39 protein [bacterium]|nr:glycosyltransferase family 39 protein [bacterium]
MEKTNKKISVALYLMTAILVITGISVFKDYGVGYDEPAQKITGDINFDYVFHSDTRLLSYENRCYGPAFEILLTAICKTLPEQHTRRDIFLLRHLCTFFVFCIGAVFLYLIVLRQTGNTFWALLSVLFFVFSPRIFAHSFFNSKDIPFMSFFIIGFYSLIRLLENKNAKWILIHSFASGFLMDIRLAGILIVFITSVLFIADSVSRKTHLLNLFALTGLYLALTALITVLFWPALWPSPISSLSAAIRETIHYPWPGKILFMGNYLSAGNLPWYYLPVWIAITTPLSYIILFFCGLPDFAASAVKSPKNRLYAGVLLWFFIPLLSAMFFRPVLYNSWRHFFFIYPSLVIIAVHGARKLYGIRIPNRNIRKILKAIFILIILCSLFHTMLFMYKGHPFEHLYFNFLAGNKCLDYFEGDYWGLSCRQGLEYLIKNGGEGKIIIYAADWPGKFNAYILKTENVKRLHYTENPEEADYIITNNTADIENYPAFKECFSINIRCGKILSVLKKTRD